MCAVWNSFLSIKQKNVGYDHENVAQNKKLTLFHDCAIEQWMVNQNVPIAM
jgi:hypothetical protein